MLGHLLPGDHLDLGNHVDAFACVFAVGLGDMFAPFIYVVNIRCKYTSYIMICQKRPTSLHRLKPYPKTPKLVILSASWSKGGWRLQ